MRRRREVPDVRFVRAPVQAVQDQDDGGVISRLVR